MAPTREPPQIERVGFSQRGKRVVGIGVGAVLAVLLGAWGFFIWRVKTVERPDYRVVRADGDVEVRDYPRLVVAEVVTRGDRWEGVRRGFRPLARYIFGQDRGGEGKIAMTAPVTQTPAGDERIAMTAPVTQTDRGDGTWTVRFIMPSDRDLDALPAPSGDVHLEAVPARRVAAIRFSGWATDARVAEHEARLRAWVDGQGLEVAGPPTYAYYDDPWMPGPLRRNEVLLPLAPAG